MGEVKFKEAYCITFGRLVTIEEVINIFKYNKSLYNSHISEHLLCPGCRSAGLIFAYAAHPYFRSLPKALHTDNCPYMQETTTPEESISVVKNPNNAAALQRQGEKIFTQLLGREKVIRRKKNSEGQNEGQQLEYRSFSGTKIKRQLPQKCFEQPIKPEDLDCFKFFTGKAILQWEKDDTSGKYKILLLHPIKRYLFCKLFVSLTVYNNLPQEYKVSSEFKCVIVFLANFVKTETNLKCSYKTTSLFNSKYLWLKKLA